MKLFTVKLLPQARDFFHGILPKMARKFEGGKNAALHQVGFMLVKTARDGIQREAKTGRVYKRPGKRAKRASAPGQYPGIVTGETLRGLDFEVQSGKQLEFGIRERPFEPRKLPAWLEEGTSLMAPRPTLTLADESRRKDTDNWLAITPFKAMKK